MSKVKRETLLDSAVSEIEYSIKTKHTKSEEVREHYLRNAIRFIEEAKERGGTKMNFKTRQLNSAILNALMILSESNKDAVVVAFSDSMSQVACDHDICNSAGTDIARMIDDNDWEGLSNFLDHDHLIEHD